VSPRRPPYPELHNNRGEHRGWFEARSARTSPWGWGRLPTRHPALLQPHPEVPGRRPVSKDHRWSLHAASKRPPGNAGRPGRLGARL